MKKFTTEELLELSAVEILRQKGCGQKTLTLAYEELRKEVKFLRELKEEYIESYSN